MVKLYCAIVGVTGNAFAVDIDADKSVGDLKDAIKAVKANRLQCDADDLQLFLAKKDEGRGPWLTEEEVMNGVSDTTDLKLLLSALEEIGDVGLSEDEVRLRVPKEEVAALKGPVNVLVVVPEQGTSVPTVSQDGVFDHCSNPFFLQFPTVDQGGDWLEFSSLLPLKRRQALYIRSSYQVIADQALLNPDVDMVKYAVVTGTPGVGKSVFVYYVMWRLIKEKKRVLLFDNNGLFYFNGSTMLNCLALPSKFNEQFWSPDLWCLVDSMDPTRIPGLPYRRCSVLLASTPRRDCIGEFKKQPPTPDVFYMPRWTTEELAKIAPMYPHAAAVWENRFKCLGGVPRLVLQDIETDPQVLLETACNSCSLDECKTVVSINSEINPRTKIAQTLIHIHSQAPYRQYNVVYASELAMQVIARTKLLSNRRNMKSFLSSCDGNPLAQSLCGYIFEPYCLRLLHKGGRFKCRELFSGAAKSNSKPKAKRRRKRGRRDIGDGQTIEIPSSSQPSRIVERVEDGQLAKQLYVPRTANCAAIDAWMPQFGGFQITVSKTHGIKGRAADDLAKLGSNGNRLFFLLPPLFYDTFTKKTPQTIEQFAILVPYPEEV